MCNYFFPKSIILYAQKGNHLPPGCQARGQGASGQKS
jgi:hypothetical protein